MANKGTKKLFAGLFGSKSKQEAPIKKGPEAAAASRLREKKMIAGLESIDLNNPQNRISQQKLRELNIQGAINYALSELRKPLILEYDTEKLDENLHYIIQALEDAVRNGGERTAEWACTALVFNIRDLRTEIPGVDQGQADALMERRLEYSHNLLLLVQLCMRLDRLTQDLKDMHLRRNSQQAELEQRRALLEGRTKSGELDTALGELQARQDDSAPLSAEALAAQQEQNAIRLLEQSIEKITQQIAAHQEEANNYQSYFNNIRNILSTSPHVTDPTLNSRIQAALKHERDYLRSLLDAAERSRNLLDVHVHALNDLFHAEPASEPQADPHRAGFRDAADRQTRQQHMYSRLQQINLSNPMNRLPEEKVRELNIANVIQLACAQLSPDNITGPDSPVLDRNITYFIDALDDALRQGHEQTATWACTALVCAVQTLRTDIPAADRDQAEALTAQRVQYSENLRLLVELNREHDYMSADLNHLCQRRDQKQAEFDAAKAAYMERRNAGVLDSLIDELKKSLHDSSPLSPEALDLRQELLHIRLLKEDIIVLNTGINARNLNLPALASHIEHLRSALATPPHAPAPGLSERFCKSELQYVQQLLCTAESDDRNQILAENVLLRNQMQSLRNQLQTLKEQAQSAEEDACRYREEASSRQAEIRTLQAQVRSLQKQLASRGADAAPASEVTDPHLCPEKRTFAELTNIDDL